MRFRRGPRGVEILLSQTHPARRFRRKNWGIVSNHISNKMAFPSIVSAKAPVDYLVIDHVEKQSEN